MLDELFLGLCDETLHILLQNPSGLFTAYPLPHQDSWAVLSLFCALHELLLPEEVTSWVLCSQVPGCIWFSFLHLYVIPVNVHRCQQGP